MSSSSAFRRIFTASNLTGSWFQLLSASRPSSRNSKGSDGLSINDFATDFKGRIRRISVDIFSGAFEFDSLRPHLIQKLNGKFRLICVPTVKDRLVQRALLDYLSHKYHAQLANKISFGFIKGRTVQEAARQACSLRKSHPWVLKTDICAFFDQIERRSLRQKIKHLVKDRSLYSTLESAVECEISPVNKNDKKRISKLGIKDGVGVRQGMPLSPFFSNVMLIDFDRELGQKGLKAVRYADDLVFFADSESECEDIFVQCSDALSRCGLKLPPLGKDSKSVIYAPSDDAEFLGLGICGSSGGYSLRLVDRQVLEIKQRIMELGSVKELLARKITLERLGSAVNNRISGYISAYACCENIEMLEHELENLKTKVLTKIYREELKINIPSLSAEAKAFLGL
jgi:RNA-directed DNA polymerase